MKLRTAHVDLQEDTDLNEVFASARKQRVAWVTGTGQLTQLPPDSGYLLWSPADDDGQVDPNYWVAVRDDLADGDVSNGAGELEFHNVHLGNVRLTKDKIFVDAPLTSPVSSSGRSSLHVFSYRIGDLPNNS